MQWGKGVLELAPETRALLDRIRHRSKVLSIYEMPSDLAEAAVWELGRPVLDSQRLPVVQYNQYRWFSREGNQGQSPYLVPASRT
ncbi:MAG TPA: hypothetical protein VMH22_00225 [bacterium]|nr:hypothetical protein [bacterium]